MRAIGTSGAIIITSATIDFPSTTNTTQDSGQITIPGAEVGDIVLVGAPAAAMVAGASFTGFVTGLNTVRVRLTAIGIGVDPASGVFNVAVIKAEK